MAVATAAATVMASRAEAARPRRRMAARSNMRMNIEVCGDVDRRFATRFAETWDGCELMLPLAARKRDQTSPLAELPPRCRQRSPESQSPESLGTIRVGL